MLRDGICADAGSRLSRAATWENTTFWVVSRMLVRTPPRVDLTWPLMAPPKAHHRVHKALQTPETKENPSAAEHEGPDPNTGRIMAIKPAFYSCTG